jgi:hypothetical protein
MVNVRRYRATDRDEWDRFIAGARNGVFLFMRGYMEYHQERFADHSLVLSRGTQWMGVLPANLDRDALESHGGLTFGGIVSGVDMRADLMLESFDALLAYARDSGIRRIVYKPVPHIYHSVPAEEDLYALFRNGAQITRRDLSSCVHLPRAPGQNELRRRCVRKARSAGIQVRKTIDFTTFVSILSQELQSKRGVRPVHTAAELTLLAQRFPSNIHLFGAYLGERMLGAVLVYESAMVAHAQYITATAEGRDAGALDLTMDHLMSVAFSHKPYFDFGISTVEEGRCLDSGLIGNKEGFGARGTLYDRYELTTGA